VSCRLDFSLDKEREHLNEAVRLHTEVTGSRPLGWYLGRCSINTRQLVMQEGGFLYDADSYADDLPYWITGPRGPHLVIPYTLGANDMRFAVAQGFNSGDQFFAYCGIHSTCSMPRAPPRRRCCRSACTAGWPDAQAALRRSSASSIMCSGTSVYG